MKRFLLFSIVIILSISLCLATALSFSNEYKPTVIRIAVIKDVDYVTLTIKGRHKILSLYTQQLLNEGRRLRTTEVKPVFSGQGLGV